MFEKLAGATWSALLVAKGASCHLFVYWQADKGNIIRQHCYIIFFFVLSEGILVAL